MIFLICVIWSITKWLHSVDRPSYLRVPWFGTQLKLRPLPLLTHVNKNTLLQLLSQTSATSPRAIKYIFKSCSNTPFISFAHFCCEKYRFVFCYAFSTGYACHFYPDIQVQNLHRSYVVVYDLIIQKRGNKFSDFTA